MAAGLQLLTEWMGAVLLHGSVLAFLTWLVSATLLRGARPGLLAALWSVALLKFLLPPLLPGRYGLSFWLMMWLSSPEVPPLGGEGLNGLAGTATELAPPAPGWGWQEILGMAYLLALVLLLLRAGSACRQARRWVKSLPAAPPDLQRRVEELARQMGLPRPPLVRTTAEAISPALWGLRRPVLVLPQGVLRSLSEPGLTALVVHELAHLRRKDHWLRWLQNTARLVFFFWPPVWWVCGRLERVVELACDQWAVHFSKISPRFYAEALLTVVKSVNLQAGGRQLAFVRHEDWMEERFMKILTEYRGVHPSFTRLSLALLTLWALFALAGGASGWAQEPQALGPEGELRLMLLKGDRGTREELFAGSPREFLQLHPHADQDGDGLLTPKEILAYLKTLQPEDGRILLLFQQESGEGGPHHHSALTGDSETLEVELETEEGGDPRREVRKVMIRTSGEPHLSISETTSLEGLEGLEATELEGPAREFEWESPEGRKIKLKFVGAAPEVDQNGDGVISEEEARAWAESRRLEEGGGRLVTVDVDRKEGGKKTVNVIILKRKDAEADQEVDRREAFLKSHPEADLDGDGVISKEEAEALARKLQEAQKEAKKKGQQQDQ